MDLDACTLQGKAAKASDFGRRWRVRGGWQGVRLAGAGPRRRPVGRAGLAVGVVLALLGAWPVARAVHPLGGPAAAAPAAAQQGRDSRVPAPSHLAVPAVWSLLDDDGRPVPAGVFAAAPDAPPVQAKSAVLIDAAGGRVLYAKAAGRRVYPASVTKILTAYVVLRRALAPGGGGLDAEVTVSPRAAATEGSSAYLRAGDRVTVRDLLYGLMLVSGNDAAEALAEHVAGSTAAFAALLNRTAVELGCTGTHFTNPSGLPDADHYTTPLDLARMARAALALPPFARIVATKSYTAHPGGRVQVYTNENRLLGRDGVDGVKTGYTTQAGQTYVASATRGDLRLVAVVLGSSRWGKYEDAERLLDWGFAHFRAAALPPPGRVAGQVQVRGGSAFFVDLVLPSTAPVAVAVLPSERVEVTAAAPKVVEPPVAQGQVLGTLSEWVGGRLYARWPLLAAASVQAAGAAPVGAPGKPGAGLAGGV
jgi:D-alanyl-D-alanine carboxypeptidase (penicillin-binding protein 5/6)